jgi:hypothetical protein
MPTNKKSTVGKANTRAGCRRQTKRRKAFHYGPKTKKYFNQDGQANVERRGCSSQDGVQAKGNGGEYLKEIYSINKTKMTIETEPVIGSTLITPRALVFAAIVSAAFGSYVRVLYRRAIRRI